MVHLITDLAEVAEQLVVMGLAVGQALPLVVPSRAGQHHVNTLFGQYLIRCEFRKYNYYITKIYE